MLDTTTGAVPHNRTARLLLTLTVIELTVVTAYIHLTLGGMLFTLNGLGYLGLAALYATTVVSRPAIVRRFGWVARVALAAYTLVTIAAYLVIGPHFDLGWITKGIEVAIVTLVAVDVLSTYGSAGGLVSAALESLGLRRRVLRRPAEAIRVE